jgi:hypothetical protein
MPPADTPSSSEHSHHERPEEPEGEESAANNLAASANGTPSVEIDEGEEIDANLFVEPAPESLSPAKVFGPSAESSENTPTERVVEGKIVSARERTHEELEQRHSEICEDFKEHRADFAGRILETENQRPTQETTDNLVRTADKIAKNRPVDDPDRGEISYISEVPEVVRREARNTDFEKDITRSEKLFAEVRCVKEIEPEPEEPSEPDEATNKPDEPGEAPAVKALGITVVGKDPSGGWALEYSHNPESINPWQKLETEGEKVIAIGTPTDAELQSLTLNLGNIFGYDEKFVETQRETIEQEKTAEAPKTLGERAVLLGTAEEVPSTETENQTEDEILGAWLERIKIGESTVEGIVQEQIEKICEECNFPFVEESTVGALYSLAEKLQPHLTEYDRMIIDDTSGRVPGLIYRQLINEAREAAGLPKVNVIFVNGVSPELETAPSPQPGLGGRTLIFTEYSQTAYSLEKLHNALKQHELEVAVDIAAVSINSHVTESFREKFPYAETRFFVGLIGSGAGDLYVRRPYRGVAKIPTELHARRAQRLKGSRAEVNRARQDVAHIARVFSKLSVMSKVAPAGPEENS